MEQWRKKSLFVVLLLVVASLVAVLALVWTMPDLPKSFPDDRLCLQKGKDGIHCGNTAQLFHDYLNEAIQSQYSLAAKRDAEERQKYSAENSVRLAQVYEKYYWEMKPAAQLPGKPQALQTGIPSGDMVAITDWVHGNDLDGTNGFERYGAKYRNGRIVVPVSGTYFVYSHLDLYENVTRSSEATKSTNFEVPIRHEIFKFNILDEVEIPVAASTQPRKTPSRNYYYSYIAYSSHVSALAELKAGDELSVKVSNLEFLSYPGDSYFGINLI